MTTLFEENRDNELNFIFILLSMVTVSLMHFFLLILVLHQLQHHLFNFKVHHHLIIYLKLHFNVLI